MSVNNLPGDNKETIVSGNNTHSMREVVEDPETLIADLGSDAHWYVIHTYSGYENKVKANLEKIVENRSMQDYILDIIVPMEKHQEIKDGKTKITFKKIYPGYVLIKMIMSDESWYVVRNTRGVTGFVGPGSKPVPLSESEMLNMGVEMVETVLSFEIGDNVRVTSGPLENFIGVVTEINPERMKVRVSVSMFGRDTPVELDYNQVQVL